MDMVEFLLLAVVGFAVVVFIVVDGLDLIRPSRKGCDESNSEIKVHQYLFESLRSRYEGTSVGAENGVEIESNETESPNSENPNWGNSLGQERESDNRNPGDKLENSLDDWEGIERSELEKQFGEAVVFTSRKGNADKINGDVKLQLYGLQKIALEGPCRHGSQPMALKFSARAKWAAWQKLGKMSPEMAMEKYVNILGETTPEWRKE